MAAACGSSKPSEHACEESEALLQEESERKSVKCCFEFRLDELNDPRRRGGGICDDGLSVSRQSHRCGGRAKGAFRGESAAVTRVRFPFLTVSAGAGFFLSPVWLHS